MPGGSRRADERPIGPSPRQGTSAASHSSIIFVGRSRTLAVSKLVAKLPKMQRGSSEKAHIDIDETKSTPCVLAGDSLGSARG